MDEGITALQARYRNFGEVEAHGSSTLYAEMALHVAECQPLLRFIASLPAPKQQPNLVFAAARRLYGTPRNARDFQGMVQRNPDPIRALILARSTQTNEPGRCAALLPALARLREPLALLEVGASAGLCLLPDRYAYDYNGGPVLRPAGADEDAPVFPCRANAETPIPDRLPRVVWRAGLDLNPLDLSDEDDVAWLRTLVWPGHDRRAERLDAAIAVARRDPPPVTRGDLVDDLPALAARAPKDATLVIFHTAVLAYVEPEKRKRFARLVADLGAVWICNEAPEVVPEISETLRVPPGPGESVLAVHGEPVALAQPHGLALHWIA